MTSGKRSRLREQALVKLLEVRAADAAAFAAMIEVARAMARKAATVDQ